jgi:hypothetical protein
LSPDVWRQFVKTAHIHGIAPMLFYTLERTGWPNQTPSAVYTALREAFYKTTVQNTLIYQELDRVLSVLQDIPIVLLKGAALASKCYPHIGLRPMSDLDLFIPKNYLIQVADLLRPLGYRKLVVQHNLVLYHTDHTHVDIELHWILAYSNPYHQAALNEWFWAQTAPWDLPLQHTPMHTVSQVYQFSPTAQVLALIAHLVIHHKYTIERLIWLYDLHLIIDQNAHQLDWQDLLLRARMAGWDSGLILVLKTLRTYFATTLPDDVFQTLGSSQRTTHFQFDYQRIGRSGKSDADVWMALRVLNWPLRLKLMPLLVIPDPVYIQRQYQLHNSWRSYLYYLYRWRDLLTGSIRTVAAMICKT